MIHSAMENSEDLLGHLLFQVLDMHAEKSLLPNFNLGMKNCLANFPES